MKRNHVMTILAGITMLTTSAFGEALMTKTNLAGFQPADTIRTEKCEIFADKVVITKHYGVRMKTVEEKAVELVGPIEAIMQASQQEPVTKKPGRICDAPGTVIEANLDGETFLLFRSSDCGIEGLRREGSATSILMDIMVAYCPVIHRF